MTARATSSGTGSGVPAGGTTGQVLKKNSNTDGDASWAADTDTTIIGVLPFVQDGPALIALSPAIRVPANTTQATRFNMTCRTGPVGSALIAVIKKNAAADGSGGTTLATLTIADGASADNASTTPAGWTAGDKLTVQTTSVGSTTAATDVVVQIDYAV